MPRKSSPPVHIYLLRRDNLLIYMVYLYGSCPSDLLKERFWDPSPYTTERSRAVAFHHRLKQLAEAEVVKLRRIPLLEDVSITTRGRRNG